MSLTFSIWVRILRSKQFFTWPKNDFLPNESWQFYSGLGKSSKVPCKMGLEVDKWIFHLKHHDLDTPSKRVENCVPLCHLKSDGSGSSVCLICQLFCCLSLSRVQKQVGVSKRARTQASQRENVRPIFGKTFLQLEKGKKSVQQISNGLIGWPFIELGFSSWVGGFLNYFF